mgnify:CR=1 FL=1
MNEQGIGPVNVPTPITKGCVVRYKEGWQRVTAVFPKRGTCNVGPVFGGRGRFSGIKKGIPLSEVYEDEAAWYEAWTKSEAYQCM